jgi:transposase
MWTPAGRAELARENLPYASSLTDAEWALIARLPPDPSRTGRPWRWSLRAILDGIRSVLRTGYAWRHLPLDFPPWSTVHRWFLRLSKPGVFERLAHALTLADRERAGRKRARPVPSWMAQAARSGGVGVKDERGYDPARRIVGRKRQALTDTDGRLLLATVSTADRHDSFSGIALLRASHRLWPFLAHCFADQAYHGGARRRGYGHHRRDRQAGRRPKRLRRAATPLGDRTNLRLDRAMPQARPRLRGHPVLRTRLLRLGRRHDPRQTPRSPL